MESAASILPSSLAFPPAPVSIYTGKLTDVLPASAPVSASPPPPPEPGTVIIPADCNVYPAQRHFITCDVSQHTPEDVRAAISRIVALPEIVLLAYTHFTTQAAGEFYLVYFRTQDGVTARTVADMLQEPLGKVTATYHKMLAHTTESMLMMAMNADEFHYHPDNMADIGRRGTLTRYLRAECVNSDRAWLHKATDSAGDVVTLDKFTQSIGEKVRRPSKPLGRPPRASSAASSAEAKDESPTEESTPALKRRRTLRDIEAAIQQEGERAEKRIAQLVAEGKAMVARIRDELGGIL